MRLRIGDLYLRKGDPAKAIQSYDHVASHLASKGFEAKAVAIYRQILKIDQRQVDARVRLGDLYQRLGLVPDALRELEHAAEYYRQKGDKQQAFDLLRRVASLNPDNIANRLGLADLLFREGMTEESEDEYRSLLRDIDVEERAEDLARAADQMLEQFPSNEDALRAFAKGKLRVGLASEVTEILSKALPEHPEDIELRDLLAEAYTETGDDMAAQEVYREIAELYKQRGDVDKSREILQRYATVGEFSLDEGGLELEEEEEEDSAPSLVLLDELAEEPTSGTGPVELDPSLEVEPPEQEEPTEPGPEDLLAEARVALEFEDLDSAERKAREVIDSEPLSDGARAILAEVCARKGHLDEALRLTEERKTLAASVAEGELLSEIEEQVREYTARRKAAGRGIAEEDAPTADSLDELLPETTGPLTPRSRTRARATPEPPPVDDLEDPGTVPDVELVLEDPGAREEVDVSIEPPGDVGTGSEPEEEEFEVDVDAPTDDGLGGIEVEIVDSEPSVEEPRTPGSATTQAAENLEEAEFYLEQGMLEEAERILRSVLETSPNHPQALLRLGEIAAKRGESPEKVAADLGDDAMETTVAERSAPSGDDLDASFNALGLDEEAEEEEAEADEENPFDLAAELESAMVDGDDTQSEVEAERGPAQDGSFTAVFAAFKAGIEEQVGEGEFDTRYDLGIGYREMGLLDDAIREFELASRGGSRRLESLSSLAACKAEAGRPAEAVAHLKMALKLAKADGDAQAGLALRYELGQAFVQAGQPEQALKEFKRVQKASPGFREVEDQIAELEA